MIVALSIGLLMALTFCLLQAHQNRKLSKWISSYGGALSGPGKAIVGDMVPPFSAKSLTGDMVDVDFGRGSDCRLVQIFSPDCKACRMQMSAWWPRIAADPSITSRSELTAVSIGTREETQKVFGTDDFAADALIMPNQSIRRAYRVTSIPQLLLLTPYGNVEWVHYGLMSEESYRQLAVSVRECSASRLTASLDQGDVRASTDK